ncbi:acyltransferase [Paraburkholderia sp. BL10I2N1]|uniref:acyltransferase family protein n=1 Tax=Paraburkholderia sp. BL10I2N1 TaxID=1938796 RepID=UPI0010622CB8|nr:acyltransferase [Paraburkholderia sp. BL10I2N1]TDN67453.1 peptidoglycan/LPS O-acetylase OafA/YrhL [Paraburkholderia sp. BL10I2N1]
MTQDDRLVVLDLGRAVAILGVVAVHLCSWVPALPSWLSLLAGSGQYGVQLFFVISAFTICKTLADDRKKGLDTAPLIRRFYLKRFARIAPLYYLGIVIYGVLDRVAIRISHVHVLSAHGTWDVLANALFVHQFVPGAINSVVPGGWSIGVEMAFYVVAPALFLMSRTRRGLWLVAATTLAVCYGTVWFALRGASTNAVINNTFLYYWPPTQFPCFIPGIMLWSYCREKFQHERPDLHMVVLAGVGVTAGYAALLATGAGLNLSYAITPLIAAATGASLLLLFAASREALTKIRIAQKLGERSYGVYIWHFLGIFIFRLIGKTFGAQLQVIPPVLLFALGVTLVTLLAYALSTCSERLVERPASRWMREKLSGGPAPKTPAGSRPATSPATD